MMRMTVMIATTSTATIIAVIVMNTLGGKKLRTQKNTTNRSDVRSAL